MGKTLKKFTVGLNIAQRNKLVHQQAQKDLELRTHQELTDLEAINLMVDFNWLTSCQERDDV